MQTRNKLIGLAAALVTTYAHLATAGYPLAHGTIHVTSAVTPHLSVRNTLCQGKYKLRLSQKRNISVCITDVSLELTGAVADATCITGDRRSAMSSSGWASITWTGPTTLTGVAHVLTQEGEWVRWGANICHKGNEPIRIEATADLRETTALPGIYKSNITIWIDYE